MRNVYIVSYDISDPKRLRDVYRAMKGFGESYQYSVFYCKLSQKEKILLMGKLNELINHDADRVLIINLGTNGGDLERRIECLCVFPNVSKDKALIV
jgi:CRISPR-associated protein Cas2